MDGLVLLTFAVMAAGAEPAQSSESTSAPVVVTAEPLTLSGHWKFNASQSEDARTKIREAMGSNGGNRGFGGGGARGGGGYGGRGGRTEGGGANRGDQEGSGRSLFRAPEELTITQTETDVSLQASDGPPATLQLDGKSHKDDAGMNETKAAWDKTHLVVETKRQRGPKTTETYSLSPDHKQLLVQVHFEGRFDVTVKRVYDVAAAE